MAHGLVLLADLNGRDLTVALARPGEPPREHRTVPCASLAELETTLREIGGDELIGGAVCAAGPEIDGSITLTGGAGFTVSTAWLRSVLRTPRAHLVNDFTACALGAPRLASDDIETVHDGHAAPKATIGVIGPDLGLGVACLAPLRADGWLAVPSEGGHIDFAPGEAREVPIFDAVRARHGRVSAEHMLSQAGLSEIHAALAGTSGAFSSPENDNVIIERCRQGEPMAVEAISIFSALLGAFAGDMALLYAARGGVYLNSPLLERIDGALDARAFVRRFRDKGRMSPYLENIPVYLTRGRCTLLGLSTLFSPSDLRYSASEIKFLDC